ncbi:hypothetical protein [Sphingomonas sp. 28-63-12]|uniref:hypothetical protein n=1 Tax=Sphingomonas sp. 28-63-12 TaxID=1970434 RepID=UPI000BD270A9|nr:MAG: hypothetical protein B7Y47_07730 [Sphingomonas sp. 28-63-12]
MNVKGIGLLVSAVVIAAPSIAQAPAEPPAVPVSAPACTRPEYHQFDFWVGHWDVRSNGKQTVVAHSLIESLYDGCAIRENWMPLKKAGGGSLSNYDSATGQWRQTWVDSTGTRVDFTGGSIGDAMVITGNWRGVSGPGQDGLVRMTYTSQPGGAVRQLGEVSTDGGKNWGPSFDFIYSPATEPTK